MRSKYILDEHCAPGPRLDVTHIVHCLKELNISQAEQDRYIAQIYGYTEQGAFKGPDEWSRWNNLHVSQKELVAKAGVSGQ